MASQDVISNGPSGRALKFLNNKNNLADLYLKKKLAQFDREKTFSVSHLDRDKFDTVDVLKQINQCESDLLPTSIRYLDKDRHKDSIMELRLQRQKKFIHPKTAPSTMTQQTETPRGNEVPPSSSTPKVSIISPPAVITPRKTPGNPKKTPRSRRSKEKTTEERKQSLALPQLERKQSVYLQVASFSKNTEERSIDSDDSDSDGDTPRDKPRKMSKKRKSFMAWIEENKNPNGSLLPDYIRETRIGKQESRRTSFFNWLDKRSNTKLDLSAVEESNENIEKTIKDNSKKEVQETSTGISRSLNTRDGRFQAIGNNVIGTLLYMKRRPLNVRLSDFYEKLNEMKLEQEKYYTGPSWEEQRRQWTLLTKGAKAAIAMSSDEDDHDENY